MLQNVEFPFGPKLPFDLVVRTCKQYNFSSKIPVGKKGMGKRKRKKQLGKGSSRGKEKETAKNETERNKNKIKCNQIHLFVRFISYIAKFSTWLSFPPLTQFHISFQFSVHFSSTDCSFSLLSEWMCVLALRELYGEIKSEKRTTDRKKKKKQKIPKDTWDKNRVRVSMPMPYQQTILLRSYRNVFVTLPLCVQYVCMSGIKPLTMFYFI